MQKFGKTMCMINYHSLNVEECIKKTNTREGGLSADDAKARLLLNGKNIIENAKKRNVFLMFLKQFLNIMILVLIAAGVVSTVFAVVNKSSAEAIDAGVIFAIVLLNGVLGFIQELKADKSMQNLKKMTVNEAKVLRDGEIVKVASTDIVVGDVVLLEAGDIVPADLRLIEAIHLSLDESSLTGESVNIDKHIETLDSKTTLADRKNMAYSGTNVTNGRGYGIVIAVGKDTEIGKIAQLLKVQIKEQTPIQRSLKKLGLFLTGAVLLISIAMFIIEAVKPGADYIEAFMTAVAVAVAAIPESLPAVVTIIMAIGVSRLAKRKAIVKNLNSVETLGCCQVICSDKTGTLTENKMKVTAVYDNVNEIYDAEKIQNISLALEYSLKIMALCNTCAVQRAVAIGDPTEVALCDFAYLNNFNKKELASEFVLSDEIPFDSRRKMMTTIHSIGGATVSFTKGGLDEVLKCCDKIIIGDEVVKLDTRRKNKVRSVAKKMAEKALRVLAFAFGDGSENNLTFVGCAGMIDPPRSEAFSAVEACFKAGMMPIMITGDHKDTAYEIAKQLGIAKNKKQVLLGAELDKMSDEKFMKIISNIKVYARVTPENKVRIVNAFRKLGKVVAMTGDGVNDAPSIKSANIGVGMGITGTDISKEAADIIVADDNFATIIIAVEEGRRIYTNIEKTVKFLLSANGAEMISIFLISLIFPEFMFLLPVHILFINLITDSIPSIALGFEPPERDIMMKEPRNAKKSIVSGGNAVSIVFYAIIQAAVIIGIYLWGLSLFGVNVARSMAFYGFNIVQFFYILSARTENSFFKSNVLENKYILFSLLFGVVIILLVALTPLGKFIHLVDVNYVGWLICIGLSAVILPVCEIYKAIYRKLSKKFDKNR